MITNVHRLVMTHGRDTALALSGDAAEARAVDIASTVMADENGDMGICHAGFAMTCLPHRDTPVEKWIREGHRITLIVESGVDRKGAAIGVPYGALARTILIYLQTRAVQTRCRRVELGASMHSWLKNMGVAPGGKTYKMINEQAKRLGACRLTFFWDMEGGGELRSNGGFVDDVFSLGNTPDQPELWKEEVVINEAYFRSLLDHPVPVSETALRAINNRSLAIDIYIWLAYRLHAIARPTPITWLALFDQFGGGFKQLKHFKPVFLDNLSAALAAYPGAKVEADAVGVTLHRSPPPIARPGDRIGRD